MIEPLLLKGRPRPDSTCTMRVDPAASGLRHAGLEVHRLAAGTRLRRETGAREVCAVLLAGRADVRTEGGAWQGIGARQHLFERSRPHAVYAACDDCLEITALGEVEVALASAPARTRRPARLIVPEAIAVEERGHGDTQRTIHRVFWEQDAADALLVAEVFTPAGHWSSYPPHKHDHEAPPEESQLEEIYYFRCDPPQGFAFQRVYAADGRFDASFSPEDGDAVTVPGGYHPVAAAPGYHLYYLNVMAGASRRWCISHDPRHAWLHQRPRG